MNTTAPGWYPDPNSGGRMRFWDGRAWSDAPPSMPAGPQTPVPPMPPAPAPASAYPPAPMPGAYPMPPAAHVNPGGYAPAPKTSGLAIASLACAIGGWWLYGLGTIAAIITGHIALAEIAKSNGAIGGKGLATAGLVIGYATIGLGIIIAIVLMSIMGAWEGFNDPYSNAISG